MQKSSKEMLESPEFKALVASKWRASIVLTAVLFVMYYGFILLVPATNADGTKVLAAKVGEAATIGIVLAVGVKITAWLLTIAYVFWANHSYDKSVERLKSLVRR